MSNYEFILKMKDMASSQLRSVASSVGVADSKVNKLNSSFKKSESSAKSFGSTLDNLKGKLAAVFAIGAVFAFTNKVVEARAEYEKFSAVLTNTFQSKEIGDSALNMLSDFAAKTPFQLNEITGAFVKLVNRGFAPTKDEMTNLGDLASSQGKSFDQLTEALLDAQTGEFERMKEFGIKASKSGDKVTLSFKGVTKEVANNDAAIRQVILGYGKLPGVAGSMEAVSKTLGGQISNLKDKWDQFLVSVGGESGGIFNYVIQLLSDGLDFLSEILPKVSMWFSILWEVISPVVVAFQNLIHVVFGMNSLNSIMSVFGDIMIGVIMLVDWFVNGLLSPFGYAIMAIVGGYYLWNAVMLIFNAIMYANPITWIIMAIVALIVIIGLVIKYTSGWGESWRHVVNGAKLLWQAFKEDASAKFSALVNGFMIGINTIKAGWYKFKEALGLGDSSENQKVLAQINSDTERRKKETLDKVNKSIATANKAKEEFSQVGIKFDFDAAEKDYNSIKNKFSGLGGKDKSTSAYDNFLAKNKGAGKAKGDAKDKSKGDSIVSGGSKITHLTINIGKLQDDTKIFVTNAQKGIENMGEKTQEMLLRAINSVNQMQTG